MIWKEIASLNLKTGPPLSAVNGWPSSSKATVITEPGGWPWTPARLRRSGRPCAIFEFLKIAGVEPRGLFGLVVEPQTGRDGLGEGHECLRLQIRD